MRIGIACDHGGFELKEDIASRLAKMNIEVVDYGAKTLDNGDDYPDFVVPLGKDVAAGKVERGIAICGSGVGASVVVNKIKGVRGALIHDTFSARQGVEDDDLNVICLGGRIIGNELAWLIVSIFLDAKFSGAERHRRRLSKVALLDDKER